VSAQAEKVGFEKGTFRKRLDRQTSDLPFLSAGPTFLPWVFCRTFLPQPGAKTTSRQGNSMLSSRRLSVATLILRREEEERAAELELWIENISGGIPRGIFDALSALPTGQLSYAQLTAGYNAKQWAAARSLMADVTPGLKHHELHSLSIHPSSFHLICGLTFAQFGRLFLSMLPPLRRAFPRCKDTLAPGEVSEFGSRRLKLFLCLYRLKLAVTFGQLQETFGWCSSAVSAWFDTVLFILHVNLKCYHVGFLQMKGLQWQQQEIAAWMRKHEEDSNTFHTKVGYQNNKLKCNGNQLPTIDAAQFLAPLGAVDGTYSVCPAVSAAQLALHGENPTTDRMYTDYKRVQDSGLQGCQRVVCLVAVDSTIEVKIYFVGSCCGGGGGGTFFSRR